MAAKYSYAIKYSMDGLCGEPLHIGSSDGDQSGLLVHPLTGKPFIPGTGIAGAICNYLYSCFDSRQVEELTGSIRGGVEADPDDSDGWGSKSRMAVSDWTLEDNVKIELRSRLKIDGHTGTVAASNVKGTFKSSGHKFETEYIGAGARLNGEVYLFLAEKPAVGTKSLLLTNMFELALAAIHKGAITIGGQCSNGCGKVSFESVVRKDFDMEKPEGRKRWLADGDSDCGKKSLSGTDASSSNLSVREILPELEKKEIKNSGLYIEISGSVPYGILTKGLFTKTKKSDTNPNGGSVSVNVKNAEDKYYIPGSSLKGAVRARSGIIAQEIGLDKRFVGRVFGDLVQNQTERQTPVEFERYPEEQTAIPGIVAFYDTIIKEPTLLPVTRIKIDKLSGGVMRGAMVQEEPVSGKLLIKIHIKEKTVEGVDLSLAACGILLLAARDMHLGYLTLGGTTGIGRGVVAVSEIRISDGSGNCKLTQKLDSSTEKMQGDFIGACFAELKKCRDEVKWNG